MGPTARSLILDLLSTLRRGAMPVRALVEAGDLFGIPEGSLRVALTRLCAAGLVERDERGLYRMGAGAAALHGRVASWRRLEERAGDWDGGWIGVHTAGLPRARRGARERRARALRLLGFRDLLLELKVRPRNLAGGVGAAREELRALGLEVEAPVFGLDGLDAETEARARRLWDGRALGDAYRGARRALERSAGRLGRLPEGRAMTESFELGGRAIRLLVTDPLLPAPLAPVEERRALGEALRGYDRLGRACWAGFLERHGVPHLRAPVNLRGGEGAHAALTLARAAGGNA